MTLLAAFWAKKGSGRKVAFRSGKKTESKRQNSGGKTPQRTDVGTDVNGTGMRGGNVVGTEMSGSGFLRPLLRRAPFVRLTFQNLVSVH